MTPGAEASGGAEPGGVDANNAIDGGDAPAGGDGSDGPTHEIKPPGFGSTPAPGKTGEASPIGTDETPVGSPEVHIHEEKPPGFGSKQPSEGKPEPVPAPTGGGDSPGPVGEPQPVVGKPENARPVVETPFEREHKGKKMITVSGEIRYDGATDADVDIDCFVPAPDSPAGRKLVNKVKLNAPGPYTMQVPANFGPLIVTAFIDLKRDGPDSKDPQGAYASNPVEIKDKDISKIDLVLKSAASSSK